MHSKLIKANLTKSQKQQFDKMFFIAFKIYVICVKHAQKQLRLLKRNPKYKYLIYLYALFKTQHKPFIYKDELNLLINAYDLNKTKLEQYLKVQSKKYKHLLTSTQVQCIADDVAFAVRSVLYSNGKNIHIKKYIDFNTISQKADNGFKYDGHNIYFKKDKFKLNKTISNIKLIELKRIEFNSGYEYYFNFIIDEPQTKRLKIGTEKAGIDPGVSTIAVATDTSCILEELAPKCNEYNKKIVHLQKLLDKSLRATNPSAYNANGTIKKGSKLIFSKHAKYLKRKIRVLYRKKSRYTNCMHRKLANQILKNSNKIKIESMNFKALSTRSKKLERSNVESNIQTSTGVKAIRKYKKKKRFGKSINDKSPGLFISILVDKCNLYHVEIEKINTAKVKASQYNHKTDTYEKHKLSERTKLIGKNLVQRDLYSAFLIKNVKNDLETIDRKQYKKEFKQYIVNQDKEIARIKEAGIKNKNFGF